MIHLQFITHTHKHTHSFLNFKIFILLKFCPFFLSNKYLSKFFFFFLFSILKKFFFFSSRKLSVNVDFIRDFSSLNLKHPSDVGISEPGSPRHAFNGSSDISVSMLHFTLMLYGNLKPFILETMHALISVILFFQDEFNYFDQHQHISSSAAPVKELTQELIKNRLKALIDFEEQQVSTLGEVCFKCDKFFEKMSFIPLLHYYNYIYIYFFLGEGYLYHIAANLLI